MLFGEIEIEDCRHSQASFLKDNLDEKKTQNIHKLLLI